MINVKINTSALTGGIIRSLTGLIHEDKDKLLLTVATAMRSEMATRIHEKGLAADGNLIGIYSPAYMRVRTGAFGNNLVSRGKNKGRGKKGQAGIQTKRKINVLGTSFFEDITSENIQRPRYNRSSDPKVVMSLTRQMENDFVVIPTDTGYALGYNNPFNLKKARWGENTYRKKIFSLTLDEQKKVGEIAFNFVNRKNPD